MRTIVILLGFALVVALPPSAAADHIGPCWHEYIEGYQDPVGTIKRCNAWLLDLLPAEFDCKPHCAILP